MAMRVIKHVNNADIKLTAVVWYESSDREYVVKFFNDGEYQEDADYFTDDKQDAIGTAWNWVKLARQ